MTALPETAETRDLRWELRDATRASHERLDARFGSLDLTDRGDYVVFLQSHGLALSRLGSDLPQSAETSAISKRLEAIQADLSRLGESAPQALGLAHDGLDGPQALGVLYVVTGSHLGQALLRRQWERTEDAAVAASHAYFDLPDAKEQWTLLQQKLNAVPRSEEMTGKVVEGAEYAFRVFEQAYDRMSRGNS